eukprot:scaffold3256_cov120-Skeletonema_menzelii.AAC.2
MMSKSKEECASANRCGSEGCTNQVQNGGACIKHGAKIKRKLCSSDGNRVCIRHGTKRTPLIKMSLLYDI